VKKIKIKDREYWYRFESNGIYVLFEKTNYFYLVNKLIIDILEELSRKKKISQIISQLNKKNKTNITKQQLISVLSNIAGVIDGITI